MWSVIFVILGMFCNFGHDNVNVAYLRVMCPLARLKYCFWSVESFKAAKLVKVFVCEALWSC